MARNLTLPEETRISTTILGSNYFMHLYSPSLLATKFHIEVVEMSENLSKIISFDNVDSVTLRSSISTAQHLRYRLA